MSLAPFQVLATEGTSYHQRDHDWHLSIAFFWTPHHERSPQLVLVRLQDVKPDELAELLRESYRIAGVPKLL